MKQKKTLKIFTGINTLYLPKVVVTKMITTTLKRVKK